MSNEFKLVPVEPTEEMIAAVEGDSYTFATGDEEWIGCLSSDMAEEIYSNMLAAAPQPPALGGELEVVYQYLSKGEFARWHSLAESQLIEATQQGFVTRQLIDLAHLAPMQAEIERLKLDLEVMTKDRDAEKAMKACARIQRDLQQDLAVKRADDFNQLKARRDELEKDRETLEYLMRQFEVEVCVCDRCYDEKEMKDSDSANYLRQYLSKPAGSEQV